MKKEQAYQVLVDAINLATTKGSFNLQDVSTVLAALQVLKPEEEMTVLREEDGN
jgi:hypothetical protein